MACSSWFDCQVVAVLYIVIKNKNKMPPVAPTLARTPDDKLIFFYQALPNLTSSHKSELASRASPYSVIGPFPEVRGWGRSYNLVDYVRGAVSYTVCARTPARDLE